MHRIADDRKLSVAQIALAWLPHQKAVTSVIVGAKRVEQLDENITAATIHLSSDELAALNEISALSTEYPEWMLEFQGKLRQQQLADALKTS